MIIEPVVQHVSDTAFWVASYRAQETTRQDALFQDPLAAVLAGERGAKIASSMRESPWVYWNVTLRTIIIDGFIRTAVAEGVDTILNLGSGLDTRPYRLELPGVQWIEADFPHMIDFKTERLSPYTPKLQLRRVKADLSKAEERAHVFAEVADSAKSVFVLTEGVTPYLTEQEVRALANDLHRQPKFKYWTTDYHSALFSQYYQKQNLLKELRQTAPFRFHPADWFAFYEGCGWRVKQMSYLADVARRVKRPPPIPLLFRLLRPLLPKAQVEAFDKMSGYALLEKIH